MSRQDCKVLVGGLSWETTDAKLRGFFENYGTVHEAFVSYDRHTGRPRGFGFVVFEDPGVADKVVSLQHTIDRREVRPKNPTPDVFAGGMFCSTFEFPDVSVRDLDLSMFETGRR